MFLDFPRAQGALLVRQYFDIEYIWWDPADDVDWATEVRVPGAQGNCDAFGRKFCYFLRLDWIRHWTISFSAK
jgi:hypothetical protein